jgi:nicotinamide mononucleotide transporter
MNNLLALHLTIAGKPIAWSEIVGNLFGLSSALLGMRRKVWAWPVGCVGNVLLFLVFTGAAYGTEHGHTLYGQAGRQVFFIITSVYGWWRWQQHKERDPNGTAVAPRWATWRERAVVAVVWVAGVAVLTPIFRALGSYDPVWADAWIFVGSMVATYAMARGWVDFWLFWIAVDLVGVPVLVRAGFYPSAVLYAVYAGFVIWGFVVWRGVARTEATAPLPSAAPSEVVS